MAVVGRRYIPLSVMSSNSSGPILLHRIRSFHSIHNVFDCGVLQAMWEELTGKADTVINSFAANLAYLKTLDFSISMDILCNVM